MRQEVLAELEVHVAALRNGNGIGNRLRYVPESLLHLQRRLEVELGRAELHSMCVLERLAGLDAKEYFMGLRVFLFQVMAVVRRNKADMEFPGKIYQLTVH